MQLSSREHGTVGECTAPAEHQRPAISQVRPPEQRSSSRLATLASPRRLRKIRLRSTLASRLAPAHARSMEADTMFEVVRWWKLSASDLIPFHPT
jgi:hypothetical protein